MNNILLKIKNVFLNRNTVTILGVLAGVVALWGVYSWTLNKAVKPQKVPVAAKTLTAGTQITDKDIKYVEVNSDVLKKASVVTSSSQLIGYYVNNETSIVEGAMFYKSQVVKKDELTERDLERIPEGYRQSWLRVDNQSTYANSIYPGDKIDLWLKTKDTGLHVYEPFITNIEVLSVKDSKGANVFDVASGRTPYWLAFAVDDTMFTYIEKIKNLNDMELVPVPINKTNKELENEPKIVNDTLIQMIDSKAYIYNTNTDNDSNENTNNNE